MTHLAGLTVELIPHCSSVPRQGWRGSHDERPLTDAGHEQARSLAQNLGNVDAIYTSPAVRCRQTVQPLAETASVPVEVLEDLREVDRVPGPEAWVNGVLADFAQPLGGAWTGGRGLRALLTIAERNPRRRVATCSHGDTIPLLLSVLCAVYDTRVPVIPARGGWFRLDFGYDTLTVESKGTPFR